MPLREDPEADIVTDDESPELSTGDEIPDYDWWVFDSSRIAEAAYNRKSDQLFVRFVKPVPGQVEYVYEGVPSNVWRNFKRSASPGRYVNRILNQYDYRRTRH